MSHSSSQPHTEEKGPPRGRFSPWGGPAAKRKPRRVLLGRMAGLALLAVVLAVAFMGHLTPAMRVQWANFVSLCGF
ncbi:hypothetical protein [Pusillimonas sp.]|uniref:hypothetical protein n=1 Tax=Pusillimonas sp. TaxID=3040095 RepID=UPI0029A7A403|nr:hypothetical protein [Pusillimonas sp.]MDX3895860.1 hypothetical protein [Pusillimonas sp.]